MEEVEQVNLHTEQTAFIQNFLSENGAKIRNRNIFEEESLWSETQSIQRNSNQKDIYQIVSSEIDHKRSNLDLEKREYTQTQSYISQQRSNEDIQLFKPEQNKRNNNQLSIQNIIHIPPAAISNKSRSNLATSGDQKYKQNSIDNLSIFQSQRIKQIFGQEDNTGVVSNSHKKNNSTTLLENYKDLFYRKLILLTKIKIQMTNYYKKFTNIYRTRLLNTNVRKQIHDLSDIITEKEVSILNFLLKPCENNRFSINSLPLFDVKQGVSFLLKFLFLVINCFYLTLLSLFTVYQVKDDIERISLNLISLIWIVEIIISLNSRIYRSYETIDSRRKIFVIYFKERAVYDIIPLILIQIAQTQQIIKIICQLVQFIKINNLQKDLLEIYIQFCIKLKNVWIIQITRVLINLFLIAHIISILWYLVSLVDITLFGQQVQWLENNYHNHKWWKIYLITLQWSLTLITTGSNSSYTSLQSLFVILVMLSNIVTIGYAIYSICSIFHETNKNSFSETKDLSYINQYMRKKNITKQILSISTLILNPQAIFNDQKKFQITCNQIQIIYHKKLKFSTIFEFITKEKLRNSIIFYLRFFIFKSELKTKVNQSLDSYYQSIKNNLMLNDEIINNIPKELKEELIIQSNIQTLRKIKFINNHYSTQTLEKLSLYSEEIFYLPGQIFFFDQKEDQSLMFILEGEVELIHTNCQDQESQIPYEKLKCGEVFGQISFFTGLETNLIAKSVKFTKLMKIKRVDFINVIKNNNKEFQQFCEQKDKILIYKDFQDIDLRCKICNKSNHQIQNCEFINLNLQSFYQRIKAFENNIQNRRNFKRRITFHHNSLWALKINQILIYKFHQNHVFEQQSQIIKVNSLSSINQNSFGSQEEDNEQWEQFQEISQLEFLPKELEACNKTYGSYQKSEIMSQQMRKRSSIQSQKLTSQSINEMEVKYLSQIGINQQYFQDQLGYEKKFIKMGTLDKGNIQSFDYYSQNSCNYSKADNRLTKENEGSRKYREKKEGSPNEFNEDINSKKSQYSFAKKQQQTKIQSKTFLEVENQNEQYKLGERRKQDKLQVYNPGLPNSNQSNFSNHKNSLFLQTKNDYYFYSGDIWQFDALKDYDYYFVNGNSKPILKNYARMKRNEQIQKKKTNF